MGQLGFLSRRRGFILSETLIALSLTALLAAGIAAIWLPTGRATQKMSSQAEALASSHATESLIYEEFSRLSSAQVLSRPGGQKELQGTDGSGRSLRYFLQGENLTRTVLNPPGGGGTYVLATRVRATTFLVDGKAIEVTIVWEEGGDTLERCWTVAMRGR